MKHFLLGTAGHVDHGKTSLIRGLTQVDTDRLPEEKERGLSIDLGFAPLDLAGPGAADPHIAVGVVDVPGHQRFLRNMIAGVGGFDAALLVVDPGEGVKPQTREHLDILNLLQTPRGLVVLSKADRYDEDTLELARWELAELVAGTFLEGAEMVVTSVQDPESLESLKARLFALFKDVEPRCSTGVARLPVDRAFSKTGFGTVVTGSLWSGTLRVGADVEVMPGGERGKVRGLQVHGRSVDSAFAGQRVAANLSGLERAELVRGTTVVSPAGVLPKGSRFGISLTLLQPDPDLLVRKFRATFFQATGHALVKVNLVSDHSQDTEVFGQLQFEHPAFLCPGDRFLLRDETDSRILGGGTVLAIDAQPFRRRHSQTWLKRYRNLAGGGQIGAVLSALQGAGGFAREAALRKALAWSPAEWEQVKPILQESGRVRLVGADKIWDSQAFDELSARVVTLLQKLQEAAPWKPGWRREEIGKLLFVKTGRDDGLNDLLDELARSGELQRNGPLFLTAGHVPELPSQAAAAAEALLSDLAGDGFSPRDWDVVLAAHARDSKTAQMLEEHLFGSGRLERLTEKIAFLPGVLESARDTLQAQSQAQPFTASQAREWLATSRKYIIPVLEWMDHQGWTHRAGDQRIVRPATPSESS